MSERITYATAVYYNSWPTGAEVKCQCQCYRESKSRSRSDDLKLEENRFGRSPFTSGSAELVMRHSGGRGRCLVGLPFICRSPATTAMTWESLSCPDRR
ncbi:hypothetical protein J6590_034142 [Homalodisca vitripennis]|nr:hypothetical protein J6590_034142 [Homalodisca vitripennis]